MGSSFSQWKQEYYPDINKKMPHGYEIDHRNGSKFDPMLGFPQGRKEREMFVSHDEIVDAGVPLDERDFCAHKYIEVKRCYYNTSVLSRVFMGACDHAMHDHHSCKNDDSVIRYKEYERERRLIERQKRRIAMGLEQPATA